MIKILIQLFTYIYNIFRESLNEDNSTPLPPLPPPKEIEKEEHMNVKYEKLKGIIPNFIIDELEDAIIKFDLDSELRLSHFLSQVMHESANFKYTTENLNYSEEALKKVFPRYFPGDLAGEYARKPILIASRVYANRMGNGDEKSQEGWKYRGRGYIQLTGKNNYTQFSESMGVDFVNNPELVSTPKYALLSAAWFFTINKLHLISDSGSGLNIIKEITRRVNGGYNGLEDRIKYFNKIYNLLK